MKKRIAFVLCMILLLVATMALVVACSNLGDNPSGGDGNTGGGDLPSTQLVDISQYLTYELNEDGNSYAVTGLTEQGYKLAVYEDLVENFGKGQGKYKLSIPDSHQGKPVTTIKGADIETMEKPSAFYMCSLLVEVQLPNTITSIGNAAFAFCVSLTNITIPNSVTSIGERAFFYCHRLIEIYNKSSLNIVAGSEDYGLVGYYAKNVYTQAGGSKIRTDANGYQIYADGADNILVGYVGKATKLTLPNGITEIYKFAFYGCSSLTSITIPNGVTSIGEGAFGGCSSLNSIIFQGTQDEWNAIRKGADWDNGMGVYTVTCTVGDNNGDNNGGDN